MPLLSTPVLVATLLSVVVGLSLGLLGGGGSILTLPILLYVLGMATHDAVTLSLLVVGSTSVAALVPHARGGRVQWRVGMLFGATSMIGAFGAGTLAHHLPRGLVLVLFGLMMLVAAGAMMRPRRDAADPPAQGREAGPRLGAMVAQGLGVGAITGLVGAGGGFVVVPALVVLGQLPMREAVGTSLLVIAMNSAAAFAGHLGAARVDWALGAILVAAAVLGSVAGARLAGHVPQALLRRGFAWFVLVMAVFMLGQEIPRALGHAIDLRTAWPQLLGAVAVPLVLGVLDLVRMSRRRADARG